MHFRKSHVCANMWICKKQTSVSHSSTEAEIISLDAGLRMDGIPALDAGFPNTNTNLDLTNIDHVPSSGTYSGSNAML